MSDEGGSELRVEKCGRTSRPFHRIGVWRMKQDRSDEIVSQHLKGRGWYDGMMVGGGGSWFDERLGDWKMSNVR